MSSSISARRAAGVLLITGVAIAALSSSPLASHAGCDSPAVSAVSAVSPASAPSTTATIAPPDDLPAPPGSSPWAAHGSPEAIGWSLDGLDAAFDVAAEVGSAAVFAVHRGRVVAAWGEIDRPFRIYSMRKGMYNAVLGSLEHRGLLDRGATIGSLGIDDLEGLTEAEQQATVEHVMTARSGVYHASAYETREMKLGRPARGAHAPGTHWFYNNWDFNVTAALAGRAHRRTFRWWFFSDLVVPLGMEDYEPERVFAFLEPSRSQYPAWIMELSARDIARVGELYRRGGRRGGAQLISQDWIDWTWTPATTFGPEHRRGAGNGFGAMWWTSPGGGADAPLHERFPRYWSSGSGGQILAVIPDLDLVFVHLTDMENGRGVGQAEARRVLDAIITALDEDAVLNPPDLRARDRVPVRPRALPGATPPRQWPEIVALDDTARASIVGTYRGGPMTVVVHMFEDRVFARPEGVPLAEVELFLGDDGTWFSEAVDLRLRPTRVADDRIQAIEGTFEGRPLPLERIR